MKKHLMLCIVFTGCLQLASGQNYTFEDTAPPSDWSAVQGNLSVSTEHYKEGARSLQWTTSGVSQLIVSLPSFTINTTNGAFMQIYLPSANNDTLVVEFMNGISTQRRANFLCNTRGWREFNRAYTEYASTASATVNAVRITLKPVDNAGRKIFFDDVHLNHSTASNRIPGNQWLLDRAYMTANNRSLTYYSYYADPADLPVTTPTAQESADLQALRAAQIEGITPGYNVVLAITAKNYVNNEMNIVSNSDGTLSGTVINTQVSALTADAVTTILQRLNYLAGAVLNTTAVEMQTAFSNYLDHVLDQGLSEGCHLMFGSTDYSNPRTIIPLVLNLIPACSDRQKAEVIRLARWLTFYGAMYEPADTYLSAINSDIMYLHGLYMQTIAMFYPDNAVAVRELKAVKRFLERYTESVPGGADMLKPDGTGFHHNTHYNNYMYAYQPFVDCMYNFRGTAFKISADAYRRFRKAVLAVYTMATLNTNDNRFFANTLCGRNPFNAGIKMQFSQSRFEKLVAVGGDCLGTAVDEELAGAYNYFFKSSKYAVPQRKYEGFYQFNYGSLGIFRKDNWVATMHAPTVKCWGSEIYSGANRFGRYQSHGALEITYEGAAQTASGYPAAGDGGGWDWNVIPGTTTVHYTSWQEMMPNRNTTQRFDQYTKSKNFAGALSFDDCGLFACDFDQIDNWGNQQFTPTNLVFKKSMFAFDKVIISLGSDIASSGSYGSDMITATNLFQHITTATGGNLILNGNTLARPYRQTISGAVGNRLITPLGTGYYILPGNDDFELIFDSQSTPKQTGADYANPATTAIAAKAYIKHGIKPANPKSYRFVVAPSTTAEQMTALANRIGNDGGDLFTIHAQSSTLHAVTYKPSNATAYAFFAPMAEVPFGIVRSVTSQLLLMDKPDASGRHHFAACNPDLKPVNSSLYGWLSTATTASLTLNGEWIPVVPVDGVAFSTPSAGKTQIDLSLQDGMSLYFGVKTPDDTQITDILAPERILFSKTENSLRLNLPAIENDRLHVAIYNISGNVLYRQNAIDGKNVEIPLHGLSQGLLVCVVSGGNKTETYKFIH